MIAPRPNLLAASIATLLLAPLPVIGAPKPGPEPDPAPQAQEAAETELETIVVTGTRVAGRSVTDTVVPIDVIDVEKIERVGSTELNQVLSVALPSFNFPRPGLADGTDTVRPATLRGLGPDQSLVLVNSKRRHAAALVNVNGTVGRGSAAVDLNTIPTAAIQTVEVLRDGASAQYGSDAIAGVLNVLLRNADSGGNLTASYGQRETNFRVPTTPAPAGANWVVPQQVERDVSDGDTLVVGGWSGFGFGDGGSLTLSFEYRDQDRTERGGFDFRQQYPRLANGQFDPREATVNRFNAWYGEPEVEQLTFFANGGLPVGDGRLYGWASWQKREAVSAGFFRRALDERNVIQIYPDGFLPQIAPDVDDASFAFGYEWNWGDWAMDSSLVWGRNQMDFTIQNTLNRSLGPTSPTVFDAGGFDYDQLVLNFSGVRSVDLDWFASPLNIATGIEARREGYSISAGEPDSWRNGGALLPNGQPTASGAQVFPGFRPSNEVDESRNAIGAYVDFEASLTDQLLGSAALRFEDYSDFGSNLTGKLGLRYDFTEAFALRGSLQNGFRAPSLQQQFFTATSTNFINGVPFDITTFPVNDPVAVALGARPLDAEESTNISLGFVANLGGASLTVDAYQIKIDDRIVLSENLTQANVRQFLAQQGFVGIGGGRFFINGVDTTTRGVDAVITAPRFETGFGDFDLTVAGNWNDTEVTRVPTTRPLSQLNPPPVLFDRLNVLIFERGNPKTKYIGNLEWRFGDFSTTLRTTRYGETLAPGNTAAFDFVLPARWLTDLEGRWQFSEQGRVAIGADNLFDIYPKPLNVINNTTGNTPFSNFSPFGRSGRFVYARIGWDF
jgi:iron complex outermembrane receptor protein